MDLSIGVLHAYPNGELQFENRMPLTNADEDLEVQGINSKRYVARKLKGMKDDNMTEKNLENLRKIRICRTSIPIFQGDVPIFQWVALFFHLDPSLVSADAGPIGRCMSASACRMRPKKHLYQVGL